MNLSPVAPVLDWRSLPAKSTMLSLPTRMWFSPSTSDVSPHSTVTTKIAWDLCEGGIRRGEEEEEEEQEQEQEKEEDRYLDARREKLCEIKR